MLCIKENTYLTRLADTCEGFVRSTIKKFISIEMSLTKIAFKSESNSIISVFLLRTLAAHTHITVV